MSGGELMCAKSIVTFSLRIVMKHIAYQRQAEENLLVEGMVEAFCARAGIRDTAAAVEIENMGKNVEVRNECCRGSGRDYLWRRWRNFFFLFSIAYRRRGRRRPLWDS